MTESLGQWIFTLHLKINRLCELCSVFGSEHTNQNCCVCILIFTSLVTSCGWFTRLYICFLKKSASNAFADSRNLLMQTSTPKGIKRWPITIKGSGQNYYTLTRPTKLQNRWWPLPTSPFLFLKRWCLFCIATPLSSSWKMTVRFKPHFSCLSSNGDSC